MNHLQARTTDNLLEQAAAGLDALLDQTVKIDTSPFIQWLPKPTTSLIPQMKSSLRESWSPLEAERKPAILDRAWTPSLAARPGFVLSLREIRRARSQRARLKGKL